MKKTVNKRYFNNLEDEHNQKVHTLVFGSLTFGIIKCLNPWWNQINDILQDNPIKFWQMWDRFYWRSCISSTAFPLLPIHVPRHIWWCSCRDPLVIREEISSPFHLYQVVVLDEWHVTPSSCSQCTPSCKMPFWMAMAIECSLWLLVASLFGTRLFAADAVSPLPVHWCSFCRPRKDGRLSQPPGVLIQWPNGAWTQDPWIPSRRPNH